MVTAIPTTTTAMAMVMEIITETETATITTAMRIVIMHLMRPFWRNSSNIVGE